MNLFFSDLNVWLALSDSFHVHHPASTLCRVALHPSRKLVPRSGEYLNRNIDLAFFRPAIDYFDSK